MCVCVGAWSMFSPDHLLVAVESLLGHELDEGGILQLQLPRNRHDQRARVEDADDHLGLRSSHVLFFLTLWRHLGDRNHITPTRFKLLLLSVSWKYCILYLDSSYFKVEFIEISSCLDFTLNQKSSRAFSPPSSPW